MIHPYWNHKTETPCLLFPQTISSTFLGGGQFRLPVSWESFWVTRTCWLITPIACTSWIALSPSKWGCIFSDTKLPGPCAHPAVGRKGCHSGSVMRVNTGCPQHRLWPHLGEEALEMSARESLDFANWDDPSYPGSAPLQGLRSWNVYKDENELSVSIHLFLLPDTVDVIVTS